jgi:hypothetical protein
MVLGFVPEVLRILFERQKQVLPSTSHPNEQKTLAGDPVKNGYGQDDSLLV